MPIVGLQPSSLWPQVIWCHWREIQQFSATLAKDGLAEYDQQEKTPLKYFPTSGPRRGQTAMERTDSHGEDRQPRRGQTGTERTDRHGEDRQPRRGQTATERTDSHGEDRQPRRGQTATERTDSKIHSFSHWAVMIRGRGATERTDSEIHSFSRRAVMARATERADSEIHLFSHWAVKIRGRGPRRGQTARYIYSPAEQLWPTSLPWLDDSNLVISSVTFAETTSASDFIRPVKPCLMAVRWDDRSFELSLRIASVDDSPIREDNSGTSGINSYRL